MGKYDQERHFCKDWLTDPTFKDWLQNKDGRAYCRYCEQFLTNRRHDLAKHYKVGKHEARAANFRRKTQPTLQMMGAVRPQKAGKRIDLILTVWIACHAAISTVDHLGELLRGLGAGSPLEHLRLHRTKCTMIIKNVLSPALLRDLVADIGNRPFSLILDESTDVATMKYLAFMVRYYSLSKKCIVTQFLGFTEVESATAQALYDLTKAFLAEVGLDVRNMVGLGTDGALSLCSTVHEDSSVFTMLKREVPNLQLIKCVCHTLHLAASHASKCLPDQLEFLVRETRNFFHKSSLRRLNYQALFAAINNGDMPLKLVQLSGTRWLAWSRAITVVVSQWDELKAYFEQLVPTLRPSDKCANARELHALLQDPINRLYLLFLKPITAEVSRVNVSFQGDNIEVTRVFVELRNIIDGFLRQILKPSRIPFSRQVDAFMRPEDFTAVKAALADPSAYLPYEAMEFGTGFRIYLAQVSNVINGGRLRELQQGCVRYLENLCRELVTLLPDNGVLYEALEGFTPTNALSRVAGARKKFLDLPYGLLPQGTDLDALKSEWDRLPGVDWTLVFEGNVPTKSTDFWCQIFNYEADGSTPFRGIAGFALRVLSLPFSNASVERAFSIMNAIKTKVRNQMGLHILMAIMRIRHTIRCCTNFEPSDEMYALFTSNMYEKKACIEEDQEELEAIREVEGILPPEADIGTAISLTDVLGNL